MLISEEPYKFKIGDKVRAKSHSRRRGNHWTVGIIKALNTRLIGPKGAPKERVKSYDIHVGTRCNSYLEQHCRMMD